MKTRMELVSPAGNVEKLTYAWEYGADAAYIGLKKFSLRVKADNFHETEYNEIIALKKHYEQKNTPKKLFCALNISFHNKDIEAFLSEKEYFAAYPIDAFIIQDIGMVALLQKEFPHIPLHLSTQANCINSYAVKMYKDLGFKRIVLGRETGLSEIKQIKDAVPEMELECFAHGAMCIAYSGRCLMSAYLTGRSANAGFCSHSCRWDYRVLEERARPGEYFPIIEGEDFTALFSSKDLCMIDHLEEMQSSGVDSLKIEGRMKSLYYTSIITRAYRKRLEELSGTMSHQDVLPFVEEIENVAHREFTTAFYFSSQEANKTTRGESSAPYMLAGTIGEDISGSNPILPPLQDGEKDFEFISMNKITADQKIEYIGPDVCSIEDTDYILFNPLNGEKREWICHGHPCVIRTRAKISPRFIVRAFDSEWDKTQLTENQPRKIPKKSLHM